MTRLVHSKVISILNYRGPQKDMARTVIEIEAMPLRKARTLEKSHSKSNDYSEHLHMIAEPRRMLTTWLPPVHVLHEQLNIHEQT
jgi:hypothetical protein